ncbi:hypothetical protein THAOC_30024, partial [Thalassiosira oceanica]
PEELRRAHLHGRVVLARRHGDGLVVERRHVWTYGGGVDDAVRNGDGGRLEGFDLKLTVEVRRGYGVVPPPAAAGRVPPAGGRRPVRDGRGGRVGLDRRPYVVDSHARPILRADVFRVGISRGRAFRRIAPPDSRRDGITELGPVPREWIKDRLDKTLDMSRRSRLRMQLAKIERGRTIQRPVRPDAIHPAIDAEESAKRSPEETAQTWNRCTMQAIAMQDDEALLLQRPEARSTTSSSSKIGAPLRCRADSASRVSAHGLRAPSRHLQYEGRRARAFMCIKVQFRVYFYLFRFQGLVWSVEDPLGLSQTGKVEETDTKLHGLAALIEADEGDAEQAAKDSEEVEPQAGSGMKYIQVDSGEDGVSRYAAVTNEGERPVSIEKWLELVGGSTVDGERASAGLSDVISACPYRSLFLETPGTTREASASDPFEFVLVDAPRLLYAERDPDAGSFAGHFEACLRDRGDGDAPPTVCHFENLGGDAGLVAPLPQEGVELRTYSHLAAFGYALGTEFEVVAVYERDGSELAPPQA